MLGLAACLAKDVVDKDPGFAKYPALQCVRGLGFQYFLIYTCLAIVRTANEFDGFAFTGVHTTLETACTTVTYAPMLSVLFFGTRMRAI